MQRAYDDPAADAPFRLDMVAARLAELLGKPVDKAGDTVGPAAQKLAAELKPEPGKTFAHVEFTKDGKYVLASLWEMDGALIVYDAVTLKEVKRIPMKKPVGKYNVWNKISKSEGTSL